jgi:hypothetical protein
MEFLGVLFHSLHTLLHFVLFLKFLRFSNWQWLFDLVFPHTQQPDDRQRFGVGKAGESGKKFFSIRTIKRKTWYIEKKKP